VGASFIEDGPGTLEPLRMTPRYYLTIGLLVLQESSNSTISSWSDTWSRCSHRVGTSLTDRAR
jgi:hypothetical protein